MSFARRRRRHHVGFFLPLFPLALACGGAPPPPAPAPAASAKPVEKTPPPPDLSAVARPDSLVVYGRISHPDKVLKVAGGWAHVPLPGADVLGNLMTGVAIGRALDLSQPVDVAIALGGTADAPDPQIAISAAVTSMEDARGAFSKYKLEPGPNGATRVRGLGDPDDEDDRPCDLAPSAGRAAVRLVCGDGKSTLVALEPWLARSAPREELASDLHVEVRLAPVRPLVKQFRGMLPAVAASALDARSAPPVVGQAIDAAVGDVADFAGDLDALTIDANVSDPSADANVTATFGGTTSLLARLALAHPERADAPPAAFWRVPADADAAGFFRGVDAKDLQHARDLAQGVVLAALEKQGFAESDAKALVDPAMRYADLYAGPIVYAKGVDVAALDKARAAVDGAKTDTAREEAKRALAANAAGWSLVQTDQPASKVGGIAKDFAAALARTGLAKWAKEHGGTPAPSAKLAAAPKGLPADSVHLELTAYEEAEPPPPPPQGKKGAPAPKKPAPKPRTVHLLVVPDAGKTWIATAVSAELAASKAKAALTGAPDSGTLAKRDSLDALRDARAGSGGFLTARAILASSPMRYLLGKTGSPSTAMLESLAQGGAPIVLTGHADPKPMGGQWTVTARAPRQAIEDVIKLAMLRRF